MKSRPRQAIEARPTGTAGVITAALVVIASKLGLDLTAEEASVIVGAIVAVVSYLTPR